MYQNISDTFKVVVLKLMEEKLYHSRPTKQIYENKLPSKSSPLVYVTGWAEWKVRQGWVKHGFHHALEVGWWERKQWARLGWSGSLNTTTLVVTK